jgi:hypothetical protein
MMRLLLPRQLLLLPRGPRVKRTKSNSASSPGSRSRAFSFVGRFTRPFAVRACVRACGRLEGSRRMVRGFR